jgi:hypothetical protein
VTAFREMRVLLFTLCVVATFMVSGAHGHNHYGDAIPPMWDRLDVHKARYKEVESRLETVARSTDVQAFRSRYGGAHRHRLGKINCDECVLIMTVIQDIAVSGPSTLNNTEHLVAAVCALKYYNDSKAMKACDDIVKIAFILLPLINRGLTSLGWDIPITVCSNLVQVCQQPCCDTAYTPEQFHLSFGARDGATSGMSGSMGLTWVTLQQPTAPFLAFRVAASNDEWMTIDAGTRTYTEGGWVGCILTAKMTGLTAATTYEYMVGSVQANSTAYNFTTLPADAGTPARPLRFLAVADMGTVNSADTINSMTSLVLQGEVDFVLHYGDIGYADADEPKWDVFLRSIEPITSRVPYMVTPGNHEFYWNFTAYRNRFSGMPTNDAPAQFFDGALFYDFNVGPASFIMLDTESVIDTPEVEDNQVEFLKQRLDAAKTRRALTFVSHHRPLYCSADMKLDCGLWSDVLRGRLEKIYRDGNVAIVQTGHIHNYERTFPVYDGQVVSTNLTNPSAPVYIVNGAGGNREGLNSFKYNNAWSQVKLRSRGFLRFSAVVDPLTFEGTLNGQFLNATDGTVLDSFLLTKAV